MTTIGPAAISRRDALFDFVISHPEGVTVTEASVAMGVPVDQVRIAVHNLRKFLGEFDDINLVCHPNGYGNEWLYELVGTLDGSKEWVTNRLSDSETRIRTMESVMDSLVSASDGRSTEGKVARILRRGLGRIIEDLDVIREDMPVS